MKTYEYVDNYRGFADAVIPLRQVNFLVGENSTGKSSILDLLEVFNEFQFWIIDPAPHTSTLRERNFFDLVSASSGVESFTIGAIQLSDDDKATDGIIVTYANREWRAVPERVSRIRGSEIKTVDEGASNESDEVYFSRKLELKKKKGQGESVDRVREFISTHKLSSSMQRRKSAEDSKRIPFFLRYSEFFYDKESLRDRDTNPPEPFSRPFYELAPIRTKPRRTYDAPQTSFSPEGDHIPYLIKKTLNDPRANGDFKKFLSEFGEGSGLFREITIKDFGSDPLAPFEMQVGLGSISLGVKNVGYGVSQALPVLVEAFVRADGAAFNIQQPEVHLHPRAQAAFGDVIADLARSENKVFFVETHSDFTIDRFRINVRRNYYESLGDEVSSEVAEVDDYFSQILFFERDGKGNHVSSIPILRNGELSDDQPESYRSFFLHESLALL